MIPAKIKMAALFLMVLGITGAAYAQGTGKKNDNRTNGTTTTAGTAVKTGRGPLSEPIPPAVSTTNPQNNPAFPQNRQGPTLTNPPQHPFGYQK